MKGWDADLAFSDNEMNSFPEQINEFKIATLWVGLALHVEVIKVHSTRGSFSVLRTQPMEDITPRIYKIK